MDLSLLLSPTLREQSRLAAERRLAPPLTPAARQARQLQGLQQSWADAVADIPYYESLVKSGAAPPQVGSWSDVAAIPPLTRQAIQDAPAAFLRRSRAPASMMITAGSTGTPLRLGMEQAERDLMRVVKMAEWQAFGYTPGARLFLIWGHSHLLGTGWLRHYQQARRTLADAFLGYRRVDAYRLNRADCHAHALTLLQFRPIGIIGYASVLDLFARYTTAFRARFRALGIRFVLSTAEAPPRPDTAPLIEDHFGCPMVEEYGGAEFGQVAFRSGSGGFRVYGDLNYVECESPATADGGAALITSLYGRYMPLIRYRVGDLLAGPDRLSNGHVDSFAAVGGRINDVIHLAGGDAIHSVAVFHCIHQEPSVQNIQMVLRDEGIDICLVSMATERVALEARLRQRLSQVHPALGRARFVYGEDVQASRAGKRRWFVDRRTPR
jgi:phenylacetate-coenzyme A ligase PaaK-like adenylate-forming protein